MIEFRNVALRYHYDEYAVLKDLNFTLVDGVNTILCDTQSGKTSVCKLLTKQFAPTNGQIFIDGTDIGGIANKSLGILYMPADPTFFESRSVGYNVSYPLKIRKMPKTEISKRVDDTVKLVGLTNLKVKVRNLSAAERKRVAIVRGLTVERRITLLDDFCGDSQMLDETLDLIKNGIIVILTSNIEFARGNTIILDGGISVYQGDVEGAKKTRSSLEWLVDVLRSD